MAMEETEHTIHTHTCTCSNSLRSMLTTNISYTYFDVLEFKHVSLYESASNLLIGPSYEQLVIVICLPSHNEANAIT